jgi:hypothetical protein
MVLRIRKIVDYIITLVLIIFIILSFCIRDSRLIAALGNDGSFYYSDEFTGGVEDSLAFGIASVIFFPVTIFLLLKSIKNRKKDTRILGKPGELLFIFITITLQLLITYEWNDKADFLLNFLYGTVMIRLWFICLFFIIFYFVYAIVYEIFINF